MPTIQEMLKEEERKELEKKEYYKKNALILTKIEFPNLNNINERIINNFLYLFLQGYCVRDNFLIFSEYKLSNNSIIDIIINKQIGIEIKFNPDKNELHRFIGQLWDYSYLIPNIIGYIVFSNRLINMNGFMNPKPTNSEIIVKYIDNSIKLDSLIKNDV